MPLLSELKTDFAIDDKVTILGYSDRYPAKVVAVSNDGKKVTVSRLKFKLDPNGVKPELHIGGFSANCSNVDKLTYIIDEDFSYGIYEFTLKSGKLDPLYNKGNTVSHWWSEKGSTTKYRNTLIGGWSPCHDYNF